MKKNILLVSILFPLLLLSQEKQPLPNETNVVIENDLQRAIFLYKNKQFAQALELFNRISKNMDDTKNIDFYLGRSNYETKNYEMALAAYERVLINDPTNLRIRLEVAQTYLKMGLLPDAKKEFESVLLTPDLPIVVKENIQQQLDFIEGKTKKHFVNVMAIFGMGYDSNINTQNDAKSIYVPTLDGNIDLTTGVNGAVTTEIGTVINHLYKVNESFYFQNSATIFAMRYNSYMENNIGVVSLSTTPTKIDNKSMYALTLGVDHVWYGGVNYLNSYNLIPQFSYAFEKNLLYDVNFKYSLKEFYDPNESNDASVYEFSNKISYINETFGMFRGELLLGKEIKDEKSLGNDTLSKKYYTINLSNTYSIDAKNALNTTLGQTQSRYINQDALFLEKREDTKYTIGTAITHSYSKNITLNLGVQFTDNISNVEIYDYDKYTVKSYLYYNF